jgi:hypothetical protein
VKASLAAASPRNIPNVGVILVAFRAYFDGSKIKSRFVTLAGLAADETTWGEIEGAWEEVRKTRGNPRCIHMTDLMALEKDFKDWTGPDRDHLVDGLLNVFLAFQKNQRIRSFASSVDLVAHAKWKPKRNLPLPARMCARTAFPLMTDWYGKLPDLLLGAMEVYFDRNEPFMRHIHQDWTSKKLRSRFPGWEIVKYIGPAVVENTPALQMADVIAWGRNRLHSGSHWETDPHYTTVVRAANTIHWQFQLFDEHALATVDFKPDGYEAIDPQRSAFLHRRDSKDHQLERLIARFLKTGEADILIKSKPEDEKGAMKNTGKISPEFKKFDDAMGQLLKVPHSEIKAKLDAEKAEKKARKKRAKKTTERDVSRDSGDGT